jgi:aspartate/methionine/tyrosine aminotransferase
MIFYNNHHYFDHTLKAMESFSAVLISPSSLVQFALPAILKETGPEHYQELKDKLKAAAECAYARLSPIRGLHPLKPNSGFFLMI